MSKPIERLKEIIHGIIDLQPSERKMNRIIGLGTPEDKTSKRKRIKIKESIRNGLSELKITKINKKTQLKKIASKLMGLKETERMKILKIEEIKELEAELKEPESELELELKFKEPILEKIGVNCKMNNILVFKIYY